MNKTYLLYFFDKHNTYLDKTTNLIDKLHLFTFKIGDNLQIIDRSYIYLVSHYDKLNDNEEIKISLKMTIPSVLLE
jgi:hypothetical protein